MQLQGEKAAFDAAGIGVAAITYDAPELQRKFIDKFGITYPVLSDVDASSMKSLGILNTDYQPGDSAYGVPYPGIFVVARDGTIVGKVFIEGYDTRLDARALLAYASKALE